MEMQPITDAPTPIRLTVDDLDVLHRSGALAAYRRTELIDGVIVEMSPMGNLHALANTRLLVLLHVAVSRLESDLIASLGATIALPPHEAPQPDIAIGSLSMADRFATAGQMSLVVEISDATLRRDLTTKCDLYAKAAIPEYWVVDVRGGQLHQFWSPADGAYAQMGVVPLAGELRSVTIPELAIDGTGIL